MQWPYKKTFLFYFWLRNICLVSFSSYLFFFAFNLQKRSCVAFSFFRLERTLALLLVKKICL